MIDLVILEDSTIISMLRDSKFTSAIPCLMNKQQLLTQSSGGCSSCARRKRDRQKQELAAIKPCLIGLSAEKKSELKQLLQASKIRVVYSDGGGKLVQVTF